MSFVSDFNEPFLDESDDHSALTNALMYKAKHKTVDMIHTWLQYIMDPWNEVKDTNTVKIDSTLFAKMWR